MKVNVIAYLKRWRLLTIPVLLIGFAACTQASTSELVIAPNVPQEDLPKIISTLEPKHDYIIYVKQGEVETHEVWAKNPDSEDPVLVAKGNELLPQSWSPSGDYWSFVDNRSLYVSNADGSDIRRVYQIKDSSYIVAWWLTDQVILFDAYVYDENGKIWPPPHQYYVDIKNGETGRLDPKMEDDRGGTYLIQGIIPLKESWIQVNGFTGEVEIADLKGNRISILTAYKLRAPVASLGIEFVPETDDAIFFAQRKDVNNPDQVSSGFWETSLSDQEPKLIVEDTPDVQFYEFHISSDGKFLGYTYLEGLTQKLAIYNLQDQRLEYQWEFPYQRGTPLFLWSPDSHYIVLPYSTADSGTSHRTTFGIQVMDISNGTSRVLIDENVIMANWYYIDH